MKLYSLLTDWFVIRYIEYQKFRIKQDGFHLKKTLRVLKRYENNGAMMKEFNIFGMRSKTKYLKSSGYYIKNLSLCNMEYSLNPEMENNLYKEQTINDYFNSTVYLIEKEKAKNTNYEEYLKLLKTNYNPSFHKELLFLLTKFRLELVEKSIVIDFITKGLDKNIEVFVAENSFEENKNNGSSHEFGYWLNYVIDFQEYYNCLEIKNSLANYFEKLHQIFIKRKIFYHDVVGKDRSKINVSGVILIAKAFFRYSLITKDFRFANAGMFLIDFVKQLQINAKGFVQNTFPIHKGNSRYKFPSWTINYFLEVLILKKQVLNEFKNSLIN